MLKPERDDLLVPSSIWGYSSEHFLLRCLQFQPEAAHTNSVENLTRALLFQQTCKKDFRAAVVDNIDNNRKWLFTAQMCQLGMLRWPGEWLNGSGWPSAITTAEKVEQCCIIFCERILSCEDKICPTGYSCSAAYSAGQCLPFLCGVWTSEKWQTQFEQQQYWALVLDFHLCVLRLVRWVRCGDYPPWNVRLNICPDVLLWTMWTMRCQTFSSLSFCSGAFVVWKTK